MKTSRQNRLLTTTCCAMLSALAFGLMLLEFPLLPAAPYLKMDFSDLAAVFGGILFGPIWGVLIEFIKNLLELLFKGIGTTMGFGNIQNFLVGCAYVLPVSLIFRGLRRKEPSWLIRPLLIGAAVGLVCMVVVGYLSNLVVAPLYYRAIVGQVLTAKEVQFFASWSIPFNLLKAAILTVVSVPLLSLSLKPVHRLLRQNG